MTRFLLYIPDANGAVFVQNKLGFGDRVSMISVNVILFGDRVSMVSVNVRVSSVVATVCRPANTFKDAINFLRFERQ